MGLSIRPAEPKPKAMPLAQPGGLAVGGPAIAANISSSSSSTAAEQHPAQKPPQGALYIGFNAHSSLLGIHIPDPPAGEACLAVVTDVQYSPTGVAVTLGIC